MTAVMIYIYLILKQKTWLNTLRRFASFEAVLGEAAVHMLRRSYQVACSKMFVTFASVWHVPC